MHIDNGKAFDFGKTSAVYAQYRDIYPKLFYQKIIDRDLCISGQNVLDVGTGTGVLPRNLYRYGAKWTATDISKQQIEQAIRLSNGMDIDYYAVPAEKIDFPDNSFDVITACQCFVYFNHDITAPLFHRILKPDGHLLILYMAWLPYENKIAKASEDLVLKLNPDWNGYGETMHAINLPEYYDKYFDIVHHEEYPVNVHFTRESWNGRMKSCRGIGASLSDKEIELWENEHLKLLHEIAPDEFDILHYTAILDIKAK